MRDPAVMEWPRASAKPRDITVSIDRPAVEGPRPVSGRPQTVVSSAGGWRIVYEAVPFNANNRAAFRPMLDRIGAFLEPIYVGPYDYAAGPVARAGATSPLLFTFTSGFIFTTGFRFASTISDCTLAADAAKGATQISITNSVAAPLAAGDYIELGGRLHRLITAPGSATQIWPPLREAQTSGTKIEIDDPRMLAYLDPQSDALRQRNSFGRYGYATFEFIEAGW